MKILEISTESLQMGLLAVRVNDEDADPLEDLGELLTGKIESEAQAASGDGSVVVGDSEAEDPNDPSKDVKEAFLWEDGVMTGLGFLQDDTAKVESEATAASYDGSTLVGTSKVDDPNDPTKSVKQAFIWEAGVMTGLGFLADAAGPFESKATGISADGSVVVGESKTAAGKEPSVWTAESNEMRSLRDVLEDDPDGDRPG
jgi:probable HAF family extracellular repeat protein